ncbi:TrmH family RNA methyltransferase [Labrys wisconsinensis]|uniref:tRNA G18 (Ribose-2'-O)-methylase SpoU n=1 Tax=Labrys wisconsinensis TaxID=425677 RepID=A0ABU0J1R9_9HYPH|nr:RNA methyltransferase [Labrys wisconsinensis]MDQ0467521.1 tRNA G18 (ribose-2'-O)-methylase SpoU [Labrys wisconsinensis]
MPRLIAVGDPADPGIEPYRDIRERDLAGRGGRFVIEGEVVLRAALTLGRFKVESVLLAENRVAALAGLLAGLPDDVPVHVAGRAVLDAVAGFPLHRGILAMGLRGTPEPAEGLIARLPRQALVVVLSAIANHDNIGGLFRNAAAFGADAVLMDEACCDPLYRKSIRVSAGAALVTPFARGGTAAELCDGLLARGFEVLATSPRGAERLGDILPGPRMAALFGAEGPGLPQALLDRLRTVRIDMAGGFDSLNVATTSGIVLHHLRR